MTEKKKKFLLSLSTSHNKNTMNLHNFKYQSPMGKAILILTYPILFPYHIGELMRERKLKRIIRKGIADACKDPQSVTAEIVNEASWELRSIYGK